MEMQPRQTSQPRKQTSQSKSQTDNTIKWDDLLRRAAKQKYGGSISLRRSWLAENNKKQFLRIAFADATNISNNQPIEVSKTIVDVNEKVYTNCNGSEDETSVKIVSGSENFEGHDYTVSTTKGVEWGISSNLGLQFGLPGHLVGGAQLGGQGGLGAHFTRKNEKTITEETQRSSTTRSEAHHEETVKIPPGKQAVVTMTSYRVRYKLPYTMEYKVPKTTRICISYSRCLCAITGYLTAEELLHFLDGYRQDLENVYFTQEGELRWIADRMEVEKKIVST